ncbi:hypothetical protein ATO8_21091 [Roseivivax marinus]|uniref:Lipoprotein n=1 Tax=Roseivivax marinus TaxID=1379903 RepID=W4HET9_9RHOB|nr:hypothetical protein ATO8_21091 [Roseivivax marinus]
MRAFFFVALSILSACDTFPMTPSEFEGALERAPLVNQSMSDAWVTADDAELVLEKALGPVREQRILLTNRTALPGENMIILRAHGKELATMGRFQPLSLISSEGTPFPFERFNQVSFRTVEDELGTMNYAVWTNQAQLNCVLVFRRLDAATRTVPVGFAVIDMMMRNCILGTVEEALKPARPHAIGYAATAQGSDGRPEMLSPLAGPQP